jgi:predicted ATPase
MTLYDRPQHRSHTFCYGQDPGAFCLFYMALALWHLGSPDQALKKSREALTLAREQAHPFSLAAALTFAAIVHQFRREEQATQEQAEGALTLSAEQGFPQWLALGTILRGWALAELGQGEEGIAQVLQGISAYVATGAELARSYLFAWLAEAYAKAGQPEKGLSVLAEGLAVVDKTRERPCEPELYRLKGELTLQRLHVFGSQFHTPKGSNCKIPSPSSQSLALSAQEAEACFLHAINIARHQNAKSWELRASISLARLWQQQGKQREAHELLADIYHWFTEGFDTKDLQDAKELLSDRCKISMDGHYL